MPNDEEIRDAELAVIEAARLMGNVGPHGGTMKIALDALNELVSPLPSRDQLHTASAMVTAIDMEYAGAYWLRWVAGKSGHCEEPGELTHSGPWGDGCFYCWIKDAANELDARNPKQGEPGLRKLTYTGRCVAVEAVNGGWVVVADGGTSTSRKVYDTPLAVRDALHDALETLLVPLPETD